jgi:exonuclease III
MISCTFIFKKKILNIYQIYAPQQGYEEEDNIKFYKDMDEHLERDSQQPCMIMGDFNARV